MHEPATDNICPLCGGSLAELIGIRIDRNILITNKGSTTLGYVQAPIMECFLRRKHGLTLDSLIAVAYGSGGGPASARKCVQVHLSRLRKKLSPLGLNIRSSGGGGTEGTAYILTQEDTSEAWYILNQEKASEA